MLSGKQNTASPSCKSALEQKAVASEGLLPSLQIALEIRSGGKGEGAVGGFVRCGCSLLLFWLSEKYAVRNKPPCSHLHHDFRSWIQKLFGSGGRFIGA